MKYLLLFILLILIEGCVPHKNQGKNERDILVKLSQIESKDSRIDSLISVVIAQNIEYLENECFISVVTTNNNELSSKEIEITIYDKHKFRLLCSDKDYPFIGYKYIDNQLAIFFGEKWSEEFVVEEEQNQKEFIFICTKNDKKHPPSMYNPTIYFFRLTNDRVIESINKI